MRTVIFAASLAFAACTGAPGASQPISGGVQQGAPNTAFTPAFEGQTRAPEAPSGVVIETQVIATGLNHPWAIVFLPDGRMLVTERAGALRVVTRDGAISTPVQGLPEIFVRAQGGLLDVVLSPTFASDRLIFWSYAEPRDGGNSTSVARGRLSEDTARVENVQVIFRQQPAYNGRAHYGSRIVFDSGGRLYVTLGERQRPDIRGRAQDLTSTIGKVVRINADGSVPLDNPFAGRDGARAEIWSYGHRNVQGADLNPETGALWTIEHGPQGGDELNVPRAGRNYGWPIISYGEDYDDSPIGEGITARDGLEQPIYYWDPVIAPGDMDFYRGALFPWRGDILIGGMENGELVRLKIDGERVIGEERFALGLGRIRDMAESEDGAVWIITDEDNGRIIRLTPRG